MRSSSSRWVIALLLVAGCQRAHSQNNLPPLTDSCTSAADCSGGMQCVGGACRVAAAGFGKSCQSTADCNTGLRCDLSAHQCVQCLTIDDCPLGQSCGSAGLCEDGSGGGGDTDSAGGDSNPGGGDAARPAGDSSGTASGGSLDPCQSDNDCAAPLGCRPMAKGGEQRCMGPCTGASDCPAGTRCLPEGSAMHCLGDDVGHSCSDASGCNYACLVGQSYCTAPCDTGADCPSGYGCMAIGTPPQRVCVRVEAPCDASDTSACIAAAACDTSMLVSGCTIACNSASDCPQRAAGLPAWTCDGLCRRPADVYGPQAPDSTPAQWACNNADAVVNVCNDGEHIDWSTDSVPNPPTVSCAASTTTDGIGNDQCVDTCTYRGGCTSGYACVAIGSANGTRIGLCVPEGPTATGGACTHNSDCVFGYCANGHCSRDCTADGVCPAPSSCVATGGPSVGSMAFRRCQ